MGKARFSFSAVVGSLLETLGQRAVYCGAGAWMVKRWKNVEIRALTLTVRLRFWSDGEREECCIYLYEE